MIVRSILALLVVVSVTSGLAAQSPQKLEATKQKVLGKWWNSDKQQYIEFLPDGSCAEGSFYSDQWHVETGRLSVNGDSFSCNSGILDLVRPNTLTRDFGMGGDVDKYYRGPLPAIALQHPLTLAVAQGLLTRHINLLMAENTLFTCHACYDPDKGENDSSPLVTTFSGPLIPFLEQRGYLRESGAQQFLTRKAKLSPYYQIDSGGMSGLRIANFRNAIISGSGGSISDPKHVSIQYEFVPTPLTAPVFGSLHHVNSTASFTYRNEAWEICIGCKN